MQREAHPIPTAMVMSAGTGGTSATLGRHILYKGYETDLIVVDPENPVFYDSFMSGDRELRINRFSRISDLYIALEVGLYGTARAYQLGAKTFGRSLGLFIALYKAT